MRILTLLSLCTFLFCVNARSSQSTAGDISAQVDSLLAEVIPPPDATSSASIPNTQPPKNFYIPEGYFDYAKYNDLKDVRDYDFTSRDKRESINATSLRILEAIAEDPSRFTGVHGLSFHTERNAMAPLGRNGQRNERQEFVISDDRSYRRTNAIYGVYYENIKEVTGDVYKDATELKYVFDADLIIFSHSDELGGFFTRVSVRIDWQKKGLSSDEMITIISSTDHRQTYETILLENTDFKIEVDLSLQKTILEDPVNNIIIAFPVTAGAIDNRSSIDGEVNSMTLQVPASLRARRRENAELRKEYQEFNINSSVLVKNSVWNSWANTAARTYPADYKGRPFIAIIDKNFLEYDEQGNVIDFSHGYRQIGFHYKIVPENQGLLRGYYSHGCLRTPDPALYTLHAILNLGPKDFIPVEVKKFQDNNEHATIDSLMPRITDSYKQTIYKRKTPAINVDRVWCKPNKSYTVKEYVSNRSPEDVYETIADSGCLTSVAAVKGNVSDINNYLVDSRHFRAPPATIYGIETLHVPIHDREKFLSQPNIKNQIATHRPYLSTETSVNSYISDYSEEKQLDKIDLIATIKNTPRAHFKFMPLKSLWADTQRAIDKLNKHNEDSLRQNEDFYVTKCSEKINPDSYCHQVLKNLNVLYKKLSD